MIAASESDAAVSDVDWKVSRSKVALICFNSLTFKSARIIFFVAYPAPLSLIRFNSLKSLSSGKSFTKTLTHNVVQP